LKVTLINYTPNAMQTLVFTKNTRLKMEGIAFDEIMRWSEEKLLKELEYMRGTIQSSWEFVQYIFVIEGVSRAFTHQLVRHRVGTSFAQQSQRSVDMEGFDYITGGSIKHDFERYETYELSMAQINMKYSQLLKQGADVQDARGLLPTNIATNIVFGANLRTLHEMGLKRLCVKTQGEFQDVFREIVKCVVDVHPWAKDFIKVHCAWNGTCCFPNLPMEQCPVKPVVYNPATGKSYGEEILANKEEIEDIWEQERATPQTQVHK